MSIKDVISQHQTDRLIDDKLFANEKGLGQPLGAGLFGILKIQAEICTVAQQFPKTWKVLWRRDNKNIPNSGQHQHGKRIVDERLVVYRQQLLAEYTSQRIEAGTGTTRKEYAFHERLTCL